MSIYSPPIESPSDDNLRAEYEQVNNNFRMLADIRFKLLALVPTVGGAAIYILATMGDPANVASVFGYARVILIGLMGFVATLGIAFYDQRNSELYNALSDRAKKLEFDLGLPDGQFRKRPARGGGKLLFKRIIVGHDTGLAFIYGTVLGGWFFPITFSVLSLTGRLRKDASYWIALGVASALIILFVLELIRMDEWKRFWRKKMDNKDFIRRWFEEVWNKGREEAIDEMFAADGVAHGLEGEEPIRGAAAFKPFFHRFRAAFPEIKVTVEDVLTENDKIAARCSVRGLHRGDTLGFAATQQPVEFDGITIVRVHNGKIVEAWNNFDFMKMFQQLNALELRQDGK